MMKALWLRLTKRGNRRGPNPGALVFCGTLLIVLGFAHCAAPEGGRFLIAVAAGVVLSIILRMALNFDPEE